MCGGGRRRRPWQVPFPVSPGDPFLASRARPHSQNPTHLPYHTSDLETASPTTPFLPRGFLQPHPGSGPHRPQGNSIFHRIQRSFQTVSSSQTTKTRRAPRRQIRAGPSRLIILCPSEPHAKPPVRTIITGSRLPPPQRAHPNHPSSSEKYNHPKP